MQKARGQIAEVLAAEPHEIIFTSGATESNNIALLGLAKYGETKKKKHIISSQIEHKAILEPLEHLRKHGFEITYLRPTSECLIEPESIKNALRPDTLMVSIIHVNNETGVIQALDDISQILCDHPAFFHTDASQGFGKELDLLRNPRIDLISVSGHKIYGPKGIGALVTRHRNFTLPPLSPIMFGGGQEKGIRPGTLPVHLIVGLGLAVELALNESRERKYQCESIKTDVINHLLPFNPTFYGDQNNNTQNVINFSLPGIDSEALLIALKDYICFSNSSACSSEAYKPSHVLSSMGICKSEIECSVRWSWHHDTPSFPWNNIVNAINNLL